MKTDFQYKNSDLSEEHIRQICRFLDKPYIKGEYQKWDKFSQFKFWHKSEMDKRDAELALKRKESIKFLNLF
jgi:hypothetical protein